MKKKEAGGYRFKRMQYVILISETHKYKGEIPLILIIEGPTAPQNDDTVNNYLDYVVYSWGIYIGGSVAHVDAGNINWSAFVESNEKTESQRVHSRFFVTVHGVRTKQPCQG